MVICISFPSFLMHGIIFYWRKCTSYFTSVSTASEAWVSSYSAKPLNGVFTAAGMGVEEDSAKRRSVRGFWQGCFVDNSRLRSWPRMMYVILPLPDLIAGRADKRYTFSHVFRSVRSLEVFVPCNG